MRHFKHAIIKKGFDLKIARKTKKEFEMRVRGRKRIYIDFEEFRKLCEMQCTKAEIAHFFNVHTDTIDAWCKRELKCTFEEAHNTYTDNGKIALRRIQLKHAEKNPVMAIFLGKNYLGQSDNSTQTVKIEPVKIIDDLKE